MAHPLMQNEIDDEDMEAFSHFNLSFDDPTQSMPRSSSKVDTSSDQGDSEMEDLSMEGTIRPPGHVLYSSLYNDIHEDSFYSQLVTALGGTYKQTDSKPFINFIKSLISYSRENPQFTELLVNVVQAIVKSKPTERLCGDCDLYNLLGWVNVDLLEYPETYNAGYRMLETLLPNLKNEELITKILVTIHDNLIDLLDKSDHLEDFLDPIYFLMKICSRFSFRVRIRFFFSSNILASFHSKIIQSDDPTFVMGACFYILNFLVSKLFQPEKKDCCDTEVLRFLLGSYVRLVHDFFNHFFNCLVQFRLHRSDLNTQLLECLLSRKDRHKYFGENIGHCVYRKFQNFVDNFCDLLKMIEYQYLNDDLVEILNNHQNEQYILNFFFMSAKYLFYFSFYKSEFIDRIHRKFKRSAAWTRNIYDYDILSESPDKKRISEELEEVIFHHIVKTYSEDQWAVLELTNTSIYSFDEPIESLRFLSLTDFSMYSRPMKMEIVLMIRAICELFSFTRADSDEDILGGYESQLAYVLSLLNDDKMLILTPLIEFISSFLHRQTRPHCLYSFWIKVLKRAEPNLIQSLLDRLAGTFRSLFPKNHELDENLLQEVVEALFICENNLVYQMKYRIYIHFLDRLRLVSSYFRENDVQKLILKLFSRLSSNIVLPSKHAIIRCAFVFYLEHFAQADYEIIQENSTEPLVFDIITIQLDDLLKSVSCKLRQIAIHSIMILFHVLYETLPNSAMSRYIIETHEQNYNIQITDLSEEARNMKLFYSMDEPLPDLFRNEQASDLFLVSLLSRMKILNKIARIAIYDKVKTVRANASTLLNALLNAFRNCPASFAQRNLAYVIRLYSPVYEAHSLCEVDILAKEQLLRVIKTMEIIRNDFNEPHLIGIHHVIEELVSQVALKISKG